MTETNDSTFFAMKLLEFEDAEDPLLAMIQWMTNQMMELEVEQKCNTSKGTHEKERQAYRSGYRPRRFDTRLGTLYMLVPKLRNGGYVPFFVTEKKRSEQALINVIQEAWTNGVSTRKIDRLAKAIGIEGISATQVSNITGELDSQVTEFRNRPLEEEYPVLWVDALYEKIRDDGKVINAAVLVVRAVDLHGVVHMIAVEPMYGESEASYSQLFDKLRERGLQKVWLVVSDAHPGLQAAIRKCFLGASWQRCKVHFMRNILAHVGQKAKEDFARQLKQIWQQPDKQHAISYARAIEAEYGDTFPQAIECLMGGLEDSLQFYDYPLLDSRKIASNNGTERANAEIRRRSRVVGVFPSAGSYLRLLVCYLMEYEDDNQSNRCYLKAEAIEEQRRLRHAA
ncbi:IS256 family transposase [uncultured Sphaerochaeta sp.]|uniref:IS256 family transposase n=1 Tax=uncultured Sphaerochaeta sp. TaxID=886478 RepID=UPI002A0A47B8|nr:IS256 family transposase [uncultured Sphaerochaeta sp.]